MQTLNKNLIDYKKRYFSAFAQYTFIVHKALNKTLSTEDYVNDCFLFLLADKKINDFIKARGYYDWNYNFKNFQIREITECIYLLFKEIKKEDKEKIFDLLPWEIIAQGQHFPHIFIKNEAELTARIFERMSPKKTDFSRMLNNFVNTCGNKNEYDFLCHVIKVTHDLVSKNSSLLQHISGNIQYDKDWMIDKIVNLNFSDFYNGTHIMSRVIKSGMDVESVIKHKHLINKNDGQAWDEFLKKHEFLPPEMHTCVEKIIIEQHSSNHKKTLKIL